MDNILILPGGLQIGGAEKIAADISKYAPKGKYCFHYIVFEGLDNVYGAEIESRGGKVFTIPSPSKGYKQYRRFLGDLMDKYHYKAVHSHTMFNSGINLSVAKKHGVPIRICHSHTTKTETNISFKRNMYHKYMRRMILNNATDLFACGVEAGNWLYGETEFKKRGKVIHNGIDVDLFAYNETNRQEIRKKLGLEGKFVIGHTGHFYPVKNQIFLINLMPEIIKNNKDAVLIFLGDGHDRKILEDRISELELKNNVVLYGSTRDVNRFYSAFDVFAFPSLREGAPLALIEAQTNGLPCIISSAIPNDAILTDLVTPVDLQNKEKWVSQIISASRKNASEYAGIIKKSGYSSQSTVEAIYEAYDR